MNRRNCNSSKNKDGDDRSQSSFLFSPLAVSACRPVGGGQHHDAHVDVEPAQPSSSLGVVEGGGDGAGREQHQRKKVLYYCTSPSKRPKKPTMTTTTITVLFDSYQRGFPLPRLRGPAPHGGSTEEEGAHLQSERGSSAKRQARCR